MFNLFGSKSKGVEVNDKIWLSQDAKWSACKEMHALNNQIRFVAWFENTRDAFIKVTGITNIVLASQMDKPDAASALFIFIEHYPLNKAEQELFTKLNLNEVPVLSSLDEPLFTLFGGERLTEMIKRLGMEEGEILGHAMITRAIKRAQEKLERSVRSERKASSQQEWFDRNASSLLR